MGGKQNNWTTGMGVNCIMANEITTPMEPAGRVLPLFRGEYSDSIVYEDPDIVLYENSSYVAKQITIGNPPPKNASSNDYWQMIAKGIIDADISESTVEFTKASERSNIKNGEKTNIIMGKIMKFFADLKDVAFSGSYADLSNKPTIPASAKNGKLTIQKNGTEVQTFTANQSTNAVANILVPTISNSAAVTQTGQMALDAVEKNAAVPGTLAHQVQQVNSNLPAASWGNVTVNTNVVSNGAIQYQKYGNICIVYFAGNVSTTNVWTDYKLASRLPPVKYGYIPMGIFQHQDTQKAYIATVAQEELYIRTENEPPSGWMRGSITYVCN